MCGARGCGASARVLFGPRPDAPPGEAAYPFTLVSASLTLGPARVEGASLRERLAPLSLDAGQPPHHDAGARPKPRDCFRVLRVFQGPVGAQVEFVKLLAGEGAPRPVLLDERQRGQPRV